MKKIDLPFLVETPNKQVYFDNGYKLEIIIPDSYFDEEMAIENGREISTVAIFIIRYYKEPNSTNFKTYQMLLPETISFTFSEQDTIKLINDETKTEETGRIFTLYKKDIFISNLEIAQSDSNTEAMVKLHFNARIPNSVKYSDIIKLYIENMATNRCSLKVPGAILEIMIGELARTKNNIDIPYRVAINSTDDEYGYKSVSIKNLPNIISTFTAMTSEDITNALISSVTKTRNNSKERETPIEQVITY